MTRTGYDLFFMGYGDSATTTLFGAAGMTFEKGADAPFGQKVAEHHLAAATLLDAVAAHRHALLRAWDAQLAPGAGAGPARAVRTLYAYAWRADVAAADAARLAGRLPRGRRAGEPACAASCDVRRVPCLRRARRAPATLPAGTWVVTLDQTQKHWVEAMLGENPRASVAYFYDVASWSNPLLMGLDGGAIRSPLPRGGARAGRDRPRRRGARFAGDSEGAAEAGDGAAGPGRALARAGSGVFVLPDARDAASPR